MAGKIGYDGIPRAFSRALNCASDVADTVTHASLFNSSIECIAGNSHQPPRLFRDASNRDRASSIAEVTLVTDPEVEADNIALLQAALGRRYAMYNLIVN